MGFFPLSSWFPGLKKLDVLVKYCNNTWLLSWLLSCERSFCFDYFIFWVYVCVKKMARGQMVFSNSSCFLCITLQWTHLGSRYCVELLIGIIWPQQQLSDSLPMCYLALLQNNNSKTLIYSKTGFFGSSRCYITNS